MSFRRRFYYIHCILVIFIVFSLGLFGFSEESGDLVITEIAWMGTPASYSDEWIELYNSTGSPVDVTGWSLFGASSGECLNFSAADGSTTTVIEPYDYLIYGAHQNDVVTETGTSLVDIWDSTISLNNSSPGELILYDSGNCSGTVVDRINQPDGPWFAGDNSETRTMERVNCCESGTDPDNWKDNEPAVNSNGLDEDGNQIKGTPRETNSVHQNTPPVPEITGPTECSPGEEIQLDAANSEDCNGYVESFRWDLNGDGTYDDATGESVSLVCPKAEPVKVSLKVTDNEGGTGLTSTSIEPDPPLDVDAGRDRSIKLGSSTRLKGAISGNESGNPVDTRWELLDGPGTASWNVDDTGRVDPIFVPEEPGTYKLKLVVSTEGGISRSDEVTISVENNPAVEEDKFEVKFISGSDRSYDGKSETRLKAEIVESDDRVRGSIIGYELEGGPEFNLSEATPLSFRDLKVTNLETGVARVGFFYDPNKLDPSQREEDLGLFYYRPEEGWLEATDLTIHPSQNCVTGRISISDLKGTPLTAAVEDSSESSIDNADDLVVHGPNPVSEDGCIFWFDLPEEAKGGKLRIYAVDGKLLYETEISEDQRRFPVDDRWKPADIHANQLNKGLYFYRLIVNYPGETHWTEVKKLTLE
ncbi:lamin tail domain-containing protein [Candidatus Bipolaricaulota bacterium]|nr:lamin tail domain-containing protein [Candidatus Bipolaricaulota bacterium]